MWHLPFPLIRDERMELRQHYEAFDLVSLCAELGGLMGLLLGFSVLEVGGSLITR